MLSLLLLPFKILKFVLVSIFKILVLIFVICAILKFTGLVESGDHNVHSFQESLRAEGNYTAGC